MTRETTNEQTLKLWRCRWHSDGRLRSNDTLRSHAPSHYIRLRPFAQTLHGPLASSLGLGGPLGLDWHPLAILADGPNDVLAQVADQPQAPDGDSAPLLEGTAPIAHAAHTGKAAAILAGSLLHEANALLVRVVACERRQLQTPTLNVPGSRCPALLGLRPLVLGDRRSERPWRPQGLRDPTPAPSPAESCSAAVRAWLGVLHRTAEDAPGPATGTSGGGSTRQPDVESGPNGRGQTLRPGKLRRATQLLLERLRPKQPRARGRSRAQRS
mmetsp:Transcript_44721/g.126498  ORF Transcript_44721/g.126498 Transcript_44721/m.126498 type:complete len:270 (-) Transcript_44721:576-1385(-)